MKKAVVTATSMLMLVSSLTPAVAADLAPAPDTSGWRFTLAPYVWGVGLSGNIGLFGRGPVEVDIPLSDILENLDFAAMGVAEAHNGTWGVFVDLNYTNLSADESRSRTLDKDLVILQPSITAKVSAEAEIKEFIGTFMGQWRAVSADQLTLDVMAGARYWNVENDITARGTLSVGGPLELSIEKELSGSDGASWVDPMIGVKSRIDTDTALFLTGWGMVGGFGIGSNFNWDVMGGVGYEWTEHISTVLGYRALGVDYEDDGFVYDIVQQGVALGAVFDF
jgi:opacity protein-like surface antigen